MSKTTNKNVASQSTAQSRRNGKKAAAAVQPQSITETAVNAAETVAQNTAVEPAKTAAETAETVTAENSITEPQNTAETAKNTAAENAAEKPQKTAKNESQIETVIRIAAENGIDFYINEKKPHLYLFKFKSGTDEKRHTMIFKVRYSNNKQMNMLAKAAYATDAAIMNEYFTAGKDNECRHYRYIENDTEETLRVIIGNFRREKKKAASDEKTVKA